MRIRQIMIATVMLLPAAAVAAPAPADFDYCAGVQGAARAEALYQVPLTGAVLSETGRGLPDLRLFDASGKETPFTIIEQAPPYEPVPESVPLEIIGYEPGTSSARITLKLPEKHPAISSLDLDITDRDFRKRVVLHAGNDGKTWQRLVEDRIYDFSSQVDLRKTRIEFTKTGARYFRIDLIDEAGQESSKPGMTLKYDGLEFSTGGAQRKDLHIRAVAGRTLVPAEKEPAYDRKTFSDLTPVQDKDGNTVITIPAGLPMDRVAFRVKDHYYFRTVRISGSETGKEDSYRALFSGTIYQFPLSSEKREEKNELEPKLPKYAFYRIVIQNRNNQPLNIAGIDISWVRQNLYFIAPKSDGSYSLCFGNKQVKAPDYDIARFVNRNSLAGQKIESATLAMPVKSGGPSAGWRDRFAGSEKFVLRAVVVLLVIGMGGWLFSLMRKGQEKK